MTHLANTILITGGCGYLGSAFLKQIVAKDKVNRYRIIDNFETGNYLSLAEIPGPPNVEFVDADILDISTIRAALEDVDVIIHLAGKYTSLVSFESEAQMSQVNLWGTAHLVESALAAGVKHLIYASTASVYGEGGPHTEDDRCQPLGTYASSCFLAENEIVQARPRGLDFTVLRLGSTYGLSPHTDLKQFINLFAFQAALGKPLVVFGDGNQTRPVVHLTDVITAISLSVNMRRLRNQIVNVASENVSILKVAETISGFAANSKVKFAEQDFRTRISFSVDNTRLQSLGWTPQFSVLDGAKELMNHFPGVRSLRLRDISS